MQMAFRWRADGGPRLHVGLVVVYLDIFNERNSTNGVSLAGRQWPAGQLLTFTCLGKMESKSTHCPDTCTQCSASFH